MSTISSVSIILAVLLFFFPLSVYPKPAPVIDAADSPEVSDADQVFENIVNRQRNIHSLRAVIHQEKIHSALKEPLQVQGTIVLQKPNMLRMESDAPERSFIVVDGTHMTKYYPDSKEAEIYKLSEHYIARNTMHFFASVMWGRQEELGKKFDVQISQTNQQIILKLMPLSSMVSRYLSSVIIRYDVRTGLPAGFEVESPGGNRTVTTLFNTEVNPVLGPGIFRLELPRDVWIVNSTDSLDTD